ncbi:MAG: monovalent cation/H(+) antiporter subunit G [Candidatus Acetothermia bacterium]|nr:monovalent cation/H(+) antiporter subunit G [Candidatus Bipolaricaulota bacterium]MCR4391740.1 monovalent cation/H(+) antiporter subunit G [Candidatus Acetothermia bacterium]
MNALIYAFLAIGAVFNGLGAVALLRFPDVYTRVHGATKCTTFGSIFSLLGVAVYGFAQGGGIGGTMAVRAFLALVFLLLTNPTGSHALARAAHRAGIKPFRAVVDRLEERR